MFLVSGLMIQNIWAVGMWMLALYSYTHTPPPTSTEAPLFLNLYPSPVGLMIQTFWAVGMWMLALFVCLLKD